MQSGECPGPTRVMEEEKWFEEELERRIARMETPSKSGVPAMKPADYKRLGAALAACLLLLIAGAWMA